MSDKTYFNKDFSLKEIGQCFINLLRIDSVALRLNDSIVMLGDTFRLNDIETIYHNDGSNVNVKFEKLFELSIKFEKHQLSDRVTWMSALESASGVMSFEIDKYIFSVESENQLSSISEAVNFLREGQEDDDNKIFVIGGYASRIAMDDNKDQTIHHETLLGFGKTLVYRAGEVIPVSGYVNIFDDSDVEDDLILYDAKNDDVVATVTFINNVVSFKVLMGRLIRNQKHIVNVV